VRPGHFLSLVPENLGFHADLKLDVLATTGASVVGLTVGKIAGFELGRSNPIEVVEAPRSTAL
jgi:hypothetical protein